MMGNSHAELSLFLTDSRHRRARRPGAGAPAPGPQRRQ